LDPHDITASVVRALVLYSLAEFQSGHCRVIRVDAEDGAFNVEDDGRGHAIERTVAGSPYLTFVYMHLDYPFGSAQAAPIQLHGIGMSLVNVLCSELTVTARKHDATLRMSFRGGSLRDQELVEVKSEDTGNKVSGTVDPQFRKCGLDTERLRQWLVQVLSTCPSLKLFFNGEDVRGTACGAG
jgi:DNA gyrase/topoisomerase IV subunit B